MTDSVVTESKGKRSEGRRIWYWLSFCRAGGCRQVAAAYILCLATAYRQCLFFWHFFISALSKWATFYILFINNVQLQFCYS